MRTNGGTAEASPAAGGLEESALWREVTRCAVDEFRGRLDVSAAAGAGAIYFEGGRVVHAEAGSLRGEPAFRAILRWPGSAHSLEPDARAPGATIHRGVALLLLDLKGPSPLPLPLPSPPPSPSPAAAARARQGAPGPLDRLVAVTERIRRLPGVLGATFTGAEEASDRSGLGPLDAGAVAVAGPARRLGGALGVGRLVLGVARGTERLILLIASRDRQITVVLRADDQVEAVQAQIRGLLKSEL